MDSSIPSKLRRGFRWLVSVSLIAALFWWVDMTTLIQALADAQPILLLVGLALCVNHRILMSVRWKMILAAKTPAVRTSTLIRINFVSAFLANFLPSTLSADAIRAYFLRKENVVMSAVVSSVVLDRAVGFVVLVLVTAISGSVAYLQGFLPAAWFVLLFSVISAIIVAVCIVASRWFRDFAAWLGASSRRLLREIGLSMAAIRQYPWTPRRFVKVIGFSSLIYVLRIFTAYVIFRAVNVDVYLGYLFLFVPVVQLVKWIPVSAAGLGVQEGAWVWLLGQVGVAAEQALLFALVLRGISHVLANLPGGLLFAWHSPRITAGHPGRLAGLET